MRKYLVRYKGNSLYSGMYYGDYGSPVIRKSYAHRFTVEDLILHNSISSGIRHGILEIEEDA